MAGATSLVLKVMFLVESRAHTSTAELYPPERVKLSLLIPPAAWPPVSPLDTSGVYVPRACLGAATTTRTRVDLASQESLLQWHRITSGAHARRWTYASQGCHLVSS
jgi:hypothetical protein